MAEAVLEGVGVDKLNLSESEGLHALSDKYLFSILLCFKL